MRQKPFAEMKSIDEPLRQAFLDAHNGRPPDNFVESAEGFVPIEHYQPITPEDQARIARGLKRQMDELAKNPVPGDELRY